MAQKKGVSFWILLLLCFPTLSHVANGWRILGARFASSYFPEAILAISWILLIIVSYRGILTILREEGKTVFVRWAVKWTSIIVVTAGIPVFVYYLYYLPRTQIKADQRAEADLKKLRAAIDNLQQELKEYECSPWEITEDHIPFLLGPYYGWRGTGRGVRISLKDNEIRSCSDYGTDPEGQGKRLVFRKSLTGMKWLPSLVGACEGLSYAEGPQAECFTESMVDVKTCSFRHGPRMDPATLALCDELLREDQVTQTRRLSNEGLLPFMVRLQRKLLINEENSVYSPYGVYAMLGMIHAGAHGETESLLAREIGSKGPSRDLHATMGSLRTQLGCAAAKAGGRLEITNEVSNPDVGFLKHYLGILQSHYGAGAGLLPFQEADNSPVDRKDPCSVGRSLDVTQVGFTVVNVLRFQNKWDSPFEEENTKPQPFYKFYGGKISAATMRQQSNFLYAENADFQVLEMSYKGKELAMVIFLPREITGITKLEGLLDSANLKNWLDSLTGELVDVNIPKFEMGCEWSLNDVLSDLGLADIFSPKTDLSCTIGAKGLFVQQLRQDVWIRVNEEGTRAVSITCGSIGGSDGGPSESAPPKPKIFRADHPFLFLIRHKPSNAILFAGRLFEPK